MKKLSDILDGLTQWATICIMLITVLLLSIYCFMYRFDAHSSYIQMQNPLYHIVVSLGVCLIGLGISFLASKMEIKKQRVCAGILLIVACGYIGGVCFSFNIQTQILPMSDAKACFLLANTFATGDFAAVVPKDSYLSFWPFQTGFIFITEAIIKVFRQTEVLFFQKLNVLYLMILVVSGFHILRIYTKKMGAVVLYLGIMCSFMPLLFSTYILYGNLPSVAFMMFSLWMIILFCKNENTVLKIISCIFAMGGVAIASLFKQTTRIFIIATLITLIITCIKNKKLLVYVPLIASLICSFFLTSFTQAFYENRANNTMGKGVPTMAYLAMGMQYNGEEAIPGGWNGFHSNLFEANGFDYLKTVEMSKDSIKGSLKTFREDPQFARQFYAMKISKQWCNETYATFWSINNVQGIEGDSSPFWCRYIEGKKYEKMIGFMDYHQSLVFMEILLSVLCLLFMKIRKTDIHIIDFIPCIFFIGGFLFSLLWEGQTQATLYYPIMMLPFSVGITNEFVDRNHLIKRV